MNATLDPANAVMVALLIGFLVTLALILAISIQVIG